MTYTISQAAEKTGISAYTLRYYDKEGLMPFLDRGADGVRVFKDSDFQWLKTITCLKNTGMSIREIQHFVSLCMEGDSTLEARLEIMKEHQKQFQEKMEQMLLYQETIAYKIRYYEEAVAAGTEKLPKEADSGLA